MNGRHQGDVGVVEYRGLAAQDAQPVAGRDLQRIDGAVKVGEPRVGHADRAQRKFRARPSPHRHRQSHGQQPVPMRECRIRPIHPQSRHPHARIESECQLVEVARGGGAHAALVRGSRSYGRRHLDRQPLARFDYDVAGQFLEVRPCCRVLGGRAAMHSEPRFPQLDAPNRASHQEDDAGHAGRDDERAANQLPRTKPVV